MVLSQSTTTTTEKVGGCIGFQISVYTVVRGFNFRKFTRSVLINSGLYIPEGRLFSRQKVYTLKFFYYYCYLYITEEIAFLTADA